MNAADITALATEVGGLKAIVTGEMGLAIIGVVLSIVTIGLIVKLVRKAS